MWTRGDVFFCLDLQHHVHLTKRDFFSRLQNNGVILKFLLYDLLPVQLPDCFPNPQISTLHEELLGLIASADGVICISQATSRAFDEWCARRNLRLAPQFQNVTVHIGADIASSKPSTGVTPEQLLALERLAQRPTFLCVSTVEPRKRQGQILDAFDELWASGQNVNLIFVGKAGWNVGPLLSRIRTHKENAHRLFWFEGVSDEFLLQIYERADCIIAASLNEGFGLSLIEGAKHGTSIIARDIPVFREIAKNSAVYFSGMDGNSIARAVITWMSLAGRKSSMRAETIMFSTWSESYERLLTALLPRRTGPRQLFFDVSPLEKGNNSCPPNSFWQALLDEWRLNPVIGQMLKPVIFQEDGFLRYVQPPSLFAAAVSEGFETGELIEAMKGDVFIGLANVSFNDASFEHLLTGLREQGVLVALLCSSYTSRAEDLLAQDQRPFDCLPSRKLLSLADIAFLPWWMATSAFIAPKGTSLPGVSTPKFVRLPSAVRCQEEEAADPFFISSALSNAIDAAKSTVSFVFFYSHQAVEGFRATLSAFQRCWREGRSFHLFVIVPERDSENVDALLQDSGRRADYLFLCSASNIGILQPLLYSVCDCVILPLHTYPWALHSAGTGGQHLPVVCPEGVLFRALSPAELGDAKETFDLEELAKFLRARFGPQGKAFTPSTTPIQSKSMRQVAGMIAQELLLTGQEECDFAAYSLLPRVCYDHCSSKLRWGASWSHPEQNFRWIDGRSAVIRFSFATRDGGAKELVAVCLGCFEHQAIRLTLNDSVVFQGEIIGERTISFEANLCRSGENEIRILVLGDIALRQSDPRLLAIYFRWLRIGYLEKFGLVNKSYKKDLAWSLLLYRSFLATCTQEVPFYLIVPKGDLELFVETFSRSLESIQESRRPRFLSEEEVLEAAGETVPSTFTGWHTQQVVKLAFSQLGILENYATLDSATIFTRELDIGRFFDGDTLRYAGFEIDRGAWFKSIRENKEYGWLRGELKNFDEVYCHIDNFYNKNEGAAPAFNYTFGIGLFSSMLCSELLKAVSLKGLHSFSDMVAEAPYEFTWYGVFARHYCGKDTPAQGPLFKPIININDFCDVSVEYTLEEQYIGFLFQPPASDAPDLQNIALLVSACENNSRIS